VPNTGIGFQNAFNGNAMTGAVVYSEISPNIREFFGIQLLQSLTVGQLYYGSFRISLADNSGLDCAIDKIGMKLTTYPLLFPTSSTVLINNDSKITSTSIVNDKINWIEIKGNFIADSSYQHLILGNFYEDQNTSTLNCVTNSYYFFDSVCLSTDSADCFLNTGIKNNLDHNSIEFINDPTNNMLIVKYKGKKPVKLLLVNSVGQWIKSIEIKNDVRINLKDLTSGIYIIKNSLNNRMLKFNIYNF
jgi:hypothetical protein